MLKKLYQKDGIITIIDIKLPKELYDMEVEFLKIG